jgi:hypothetical protein
MPPIDRRFAIIMTAGALLAACAPSGPREYVAPSNATIELHIELTQAGDAQWIYALNRSSVRIVITSLQLRDCENVKNECGRTPFDVVVLPGRRVDLLRVTPRNPDAAFSFRYSYTWEPARDR